MNQFAGTAPVPDRPAAGSRCTFCRRGAVGYRWFPQVKSWPGRWVPACRDHVCRQGVPGCYRALDTDRDDRKGTHR